MKKFFSIILLISTLAVHGQSYDEEALLYSQDMIVGTARTMGVAGAFSSVGADLGGLNLNPAGLGLFRSTDISISPGLFLANNQGSFMNQISTAKSSNLYFGQSGIAFTKILRQGNQPDEISFTPQRVRSFTIGINYQQQNFYSRKIGFSATNNNYTNAGNYAGYMNGTRYPINFSSYAPEPVLLYDLGVIDRDTLVGDLFSQVPVPVTQSGSVETKGSKAEINIAAGINVNDKLYIGFGLGVPWLNYQYNYSFTEATKVTADTFNNYALSGALHAKGFGVNASIGFIYRPVSWMRFGVSYQMPTFYALNDNYEVDAMVNYDTATLSTGVRYDPFKYKLRTPMKGVVGVSFFIKNHAFISIDYSVMNHGAARYNFGKDYQSFTADQNSMIKSEYQFTHTISLGIEGSIKWFRIRAGYGFATSPYKTPSALNGFKGFTQEITAGLGYRGKNFYTDLVYAFSRRHDRTSLLAIDPIDNTFTTNRIMITLGWHFVRKRS